MASRRPAVWAFRRCGKWIGSCLVGGSRYETIAGYSSRALAIAAATELAERVQSELDARTRLPQNARNK